MKRNSFCPSERVGRAERWLGYLLGPLGYGLLSMLVGSYLNVYYTDVCGLGTLWNGRFMSVYPVVVKVLGVLGCLAAGRLVDRTHTAAGKARPWLLCAALLLPVSGMLLFLVPSGPLAAWAVLGSNVLYFAVASTLYATANTLMIPLATADAGARSRLAVTANAQVLITGSAVALVFPTVILPLIGVDAGRWLRVFGLTSLLALPLLLVQYLFTRERVTERTAATVAGPRLGLREQLRCCRKSRSWVVLMVYFLLLGLANNLSGVSTFYYCNWVLGSYNDGLTQALFYAVGNFPMGIGVFLCNPICRRIGRQRAMAGGFLLAAVGLLVCLLFPRSLPLVLAGQMLKACGTIPSTYLVSLLLGEALDDVELRSGVRCDGFTSSLYNALTTLCSGAALSILNAGMALCGYVAPAAGAVTQPAAVQQFFVLCQMGAPLLIYPVLALLLRAFHPGEAEATERSAA